MTALERLEEARQRAIETKNWTPEDFDRDTGRRKRQRTRDWAAQGHPYGPPDPSDGR